VDTGVSGAKDRRPALDQLMADARRRKVDTVVVWRLDRFGRNLRHLITAIEELNAAGVSFISMGETSTPLAPRVGCCSASWVASRSSSGSASASASTPVWPVLGGKVRSSVGSANG